MKIKTAHSTQKTPAAVANDLHKQLGIGAKLVVYFSSPECDPTALAPAMKEAFVGSQVIGCTTAGELITGKMLKGSVVAMAFGDQALRRVHVEMVSDLSDVRSIDAAINGFSKHFGTSMQKLDPKRYVGLVFVDGMSAGEERLMDRVGDLTNIHFLGGSAGDNLKFAGTHVMAGNQARSNAAVLAVLEPAVEWDIIKTQSFSETGKTFTITKADEANRVVKELNGEPAAVVYAGAVGTSVQQADQKFMSNPVGVVANGEIFVRSPRQVQGQSLAFYCKILEGQTVSLLKAENILKDTQRALEEKSAGGISGLINFHCILRTLELEKNGQTEQYGALFKNIPSIGFSTYGEQYVGHINQTSTMILFR